MQVPIAENASCHNLTSLKLTKATSHQFGRRHVPSVVFDCLANGQKEELVGHVFFDCFHDGVLCGGCVLLGRDCFPQRFECCVIPLTHGLQIFPHQAATNLRMECKKPGRFDIRVRSLKPGKVGVQEAPGKGHQESNAGF
jgi:hypothetical protein